MGQGNIVPDDNEHRSMMGVFWVCMIVFIFILGAFFVYLDSSMMSIACVFLLIWAMPVFFICLCFKTKYIFEEDGLLIKTLFTKKKINYSSIEEIKDLKSFFTVHSMLVLFSSDLVYIQYDRRGEIWITPVRKQEFLSKLRSRCPLAR